MTKHKEYKYLTRLTSIFELAISIFMWSVYGWKLGSLSFALILLLAGVYIKIGYLKSEIKPISIVEYKYICEKCGGETK